MLNVDEYETIFDDQNIPQILNSLNPSNEKQQLPSSRSLEKE